MENQISTDQLMQDMRFLFGWSRAWAMSGLGVGDAPIEQDEMSKLRKCCTELTEAMPEMFSFKADSSDAELIEQVVLFFKTHGR